MTTGNILRIIDAEAEYARLVDAVPSDRNAAYIAGFRRCYQMMASGRISIAHGDTYSGGFYEDCEPALVPTETPFDMPVRRCYRRGGLMYMEL